MPHRPAPGPAGELSALWNEPPGRRAVTWNRRSPDQALERVAKWVEDKVLSAALLLALAPAMALIALLIKLESWGPVLFVQERFGFNSEAIRVYKFRTMYADRGDIPGPAHALQRPADHLPRPRAAFC